MDEHTVATIRGWEVEPYAGGYDGLHDLAAREFTGAVHADPYWLFMASGRVVGVYDRHDGPTGFEATPADIAAFEEAQGTAYVAPDGALALLYAMKAADGTERARYYTGKTPLTEVDATLSEGGFTGYVELSEDVLSGDYYVVYQGGRSKAVAYIGNARRLITDDVAFERAVDEVGIYRVVAVDLAVQKIPGAPEPEAESNVVPTETAPDVRDAESAGDEEPDASPVATAVEGEESAEDGSPATTVEPAESPGPDGIIAEAESESEREGDAPVPAIVEVGETETGAETAAAEEPVADSDESSGPEAALEATLASQRETIAELRELVSALSAERDRLAGELDGAATNGGELAAQPATPDGPALSVAEAREGTSLFVRYRSKGQPTLEDVPEGADRSAVTENLSIEHHTAFESDGATVDGAAYEAFLTDTLEYRFLEWLVRDLVFEIRDSGNAGALEGLYGALQRIDRVEFDGRVAVDGTEAVPFDLVARDRMGEALVVARLADSREPLGEAPLAALVRETATIAERSEELAGAFAVSASYFEPAALATANEATGGSLLSRDSRKSFVKLSRRRGYHLGLVEARTGSFNLAVPDL